MTDKEAKDRLISLRTSYKIRIEEEDIEALDKGIEALENQKALGEEMRKIRGGITDENVLFGFNMAIAICNKYLGENNEADN